MRKRFIVLLVLGAMPLLGSVNVHAHAQNIDEVKQKPQRVHFGGQRFIPYKHYGWVQGPDGKRYYIDEDGNAVKSLVFIDKKLYYFDKDGVMQTGLVYPNIACRGFEFYYFDPDTGVAVTNTWETVNGKKYYFGSNGDGYSDRVERLDGKLYAFTADGSVDTQTTGMVALLNMDNLPGAQGQYLNYYLENGEVQTGWQQPLLTGGPEGLVETYVDDYQYYSPETGQMLFGWQKIDGKTYYFRQTNSANTNGTRVTGIQTLDGKTYEFGADGALKGEITK